jgi:hypothetical protein
MSRHASDHLRLECRSRRIVYYPGGGYSAPTQERREGRGYKQFASHVASPFDALCCKRFIARVLYTPHCSEMLRCKIFIFTSHL